VNRKRAALLIISFIINLTTMTFGRFSYTLIFSDMMRVLGESNTQMGIFGAAIVFGYLTNSILSGRLASRIGSGLTIQSSVLLGSISLFCLGIFKNNLLLLISFFGIGAGASGSYIPMIGILNSEFRERGKVFGISMGGAGLGTMFCGYFIPLILNLSLERGYSYAWITLGGINLLTFALTIIMLKGYRKTLEKTELSADPDNHGHPYIKNRDLLITVAVYFILGFSYIIYVTFFGSYAIDEMGFSRKITGAMWSLFGINTIYSGFLWGYFADRFNKIKIAIIINVLLVSSIAMIIPVQLITIFFISTFLFGLAFAGFVIVITYQISSEVSEADMARVFGVATFFHGAGQVISNFISGFIKDLTGTYRVPFGLSSILLVISLILLVSLLKHSKNKSTLPN